MSLVSLADRLRTSYGEGALLSLMRMVCLASSKVAGGLLIGGKKVSELSPSGLSLVWPAWFAPTPGDKQATAGMLSTLVSRGIVSEQTATRLISGALDIEDVTEERALIASEKAAADARLAQQAGVQTKATETITS